MAVADYLRRKYAADDVDAVIAVYPQAVDFLLAKKHAVFTGVPVIACEVLPAFAERLEHSPAHRFVTGVVLGNNATGVLDDALRMRPGTKRVALVSGTTANDVLADGVFRDALKAYAGRLELIDLAKLPMREILERVGRLSPDTVVLFSSLFMDGAGQSFVPREALSLIRRATPVPVFGLYDSYMDFGIVGGPLFSFEDAGKTAAGLVLRVMAGESPGDIPFTSQGTYAYVYDWRELKHWGIPETSLPEGKHVANTRNSPCGSHTDGTLSASWRSVSSSHSSSLASC